jgi:hypothetical protein
MENQMKVLSLVQTLLATMLLAGGLQNARGSEAPARPPRLLPAGPPPASTLDVVDLHDADNDTRLAATTLQGLVNRGAEAKVYLIHFDPKHYPVDFWLDEMKRKGYLAGTQTISAETYFGKYLDRAAGLVVYDPEVPGTINVATMIAAAESRMAIAPRDLEAFRDAAPDVMDLRGRWKTNADAYDWAFDALWAKLRHDVLAVYHPTHTRHHLRDYLVSQRIFTFWITGRNTEQGPCGNHEAEKAVAEKALAASPPNIPLIGWWGADAADEGMTEYAGVGWAGEYGKITLANNWQSNLSVLSGIPVDLDAVARRFREHLASKASSAAVPDKVYICFAVMESGDSPTYWQAVQKRVWDDPARGAIPIDWSITPALFDTLPTVAEWYIHNATANDFFFTALSGWGYCHPYRDFMSKTAEPEAGWRAYIKTTRQWMEYLGLNDLGLYTNAWIPYRRAEHDTVTRRFTEGIPHLRALILGMGRDEEITTVSPHYRIGGTLVSHVYTRWDPANIGRTAANNKWLAAEIRKQTPENRPAFMFVHPISWSYYPSDLVEVVKQLGEEYVVVGPDALIEMIGKSLDE